MSNPKLPNQTTKAAPLASKPPTDATRSSTPATVSHTPTVALASSNPPRGLLVLRMTSPQQRASQAPQQQSKGAPLPPRQKTVRPPLSQASPSTRNISATPQGTTEEEEDPPLFISHKRPRNAAGAQDLSAAKDKAANTFEATKDKAVALGATSGSHTTAATKPTPVNRVTSQDTNNQSSAQPDRIDATGANTPIAHSNGLVAPFGVVPSPISHTTGQAPASCSVEQTSSTPTPTTSPTTPTLAMPTTSSNTDGSSTGPLTLSNGSTTPAFNATPTTATGAHFARLWHTIKQIGQAALNLGALGQKRPRDDGGIKEPEPPAKKHKQ